MKKLLLFLFCGMLTVTGCTKNEYLIASGEAGALNWTLSKEGTLTISGKGEMQDYWITPTESLPPWFEYRYDISSVMIGNEVSNIGNYAFFRCSSLTSITIGSSVTSIGRDAFSGCSSLRSVIIPNSVTDIGYGAFYGCDNLASVTIGHSVTNIGHGAFMDCFGLTEIINYQEIPQMINSYVFAGVGQTTCTLLVPAGSVEAYRAADVWKGFYKMGTIGDPSSIVTGGKTGPLTWTLSNDGILTVSGTGNMPDYNGLRSIDPPWNYYKKDIIRVVIEEGVSSIGLWAFYYCSNLTSVTIGNSVTTIGGGAFAGCAGLTSVTIPNSVISIEGDAFSDCSGLTSITIGNSVNLIDGYAFSNCSSLTSVIIGNSVSTIGHAAFSKCSGLTSVTIGNSATYVGHMAFSNCVGLTEIINFQKIPQIIDEDIESEYSVFWNVNKAKCTLFVPAGSEDAYRTANVWMAFKNIKAIQ